MARLTVLSCMAALSAAQMYKTFGTGMSQGRLTHTEQVLYTYQLSPNATHGVITHWWISGGSSTDFTIISFYIDGEKTPSLRFVPSMAVGVGFNDQSQVPWSTEWTSKESSMGAWSSLFRIPFQKHINITYMAGPNGPPQDWVYIIIRGVENLPVTVGGVTLPTTARMRLSIFNATVAPLDLVPVVSVPSGNGALWHHTLSFTAPNLNTLEGCYHACAHGEAFPCQIISTGTEDYFISSYYFAVGEFIGHTAGLTHFVSNSTVTKLSAYRFHDKDPIFFSNGLTFYWRNGDVTDTATGYKCTAINGTTVGSPGPAQVFTYTWYYTW